MSFTKTYFLCPTSDFIEPPPAGSLCLGSIIRSTSSPQYPLNAGSLVTVTNANKPVEETDWRKTVSEESGRGLGVFAQFLHAATGGLPIGPEVNVAQSRRATSSFTFDTVTTLAFEPTLSYVEEAVKAPAIQSWLAEPRQRFTPIVSLFLITGMKLVKGAKLAYSTSRSTNLTGNIGVEVAPLGVTLGPKGHWTSTHDDATDFNRTSEFVFAFRVKRLRFGRSMKIEDHNKGSFLSAGRDGQKEISVCMEDIEGGDIDGAKMVQDASEGDSVFCV
jgi:hypothetical protein